MELGKVETIAIEKIMDIGPILRVKFIQFARDTEKKKYKNEKVRGEVEQSWVKVDES